MKKFLSIILIMLILSASGIVAFSQEAEYDCGVFPRKEVFVLDNENYQGMFAVSLNTYELKCYEYVQYDISFNKEIISYTDFVYADVGAYSRECKETDYGVTYKVSIPKELSDGTPDSDYVGVECSINAAGDIDFGVTAFAVLPDGSRKELNVYIAPFCDKIVDISEVEFINKENLDMDIITAMASYGMTVKEFTDLTGNKTAVIKTKDNVLLEESDMIHNGAYIATLYEGYVVDKVNICVKYDVNCDGELTAADARLALRTSARLEAPASLSYSAADIDGKSGVTAADARLILRKSAHLD